MNNSEQPLALVTGGASGIGKAITGTLIEQGWQVLIADIDAATAQAAVTELGDNARFIPHDVREDDSWQSILKMLDDENATLSALVNNAGAGELANIEEANSEDWQRTLDLNGRGVFLGCKYGVQSMKQNGGSIVNIASALGKKALSSACIYSASKAAVVSLTESTALHCAEQTYPVRCNAVLPGFVDTPLLHEGLKSTPDPAAALAGFTSLHPVNRLGSTKEVAEAVAFLASDKCNFMTGASMSVDGALTI